MDDEKLTAEESNLAVVSTQAFTVTPVKESVIEKAMGGDEKAFEVLFMGTYRYVFATAKRFLKNDQDIYDAIQDTYLKVYKALPRLESVSSFYPWLHRICENCAKDVLAVNGRADLPLDDREIAEDDHSGQSDVAADMAEVLKQLPPEQAELLVRVYYDKMRVAEIARLQGIPVTTVHNRLNAAKKRLKELLKIRGIDKPIYGGDLIALISAAIRNAIGTELLSMAVAEEILHKVTGSKSKGATVVSRFARKQRSQAALKIATLLMSACLLLTAVVLLAANLLVKFFYRPDDTPTDAEPTTTVSTTATTTTTTAGISQTTTTASTTTTTTGRSTGSTTTTASKPPLLTGSVSEAEPLGSHAEDGTIPIAATGDSVYAVVGGDLVRVKTGQTAAAVCIPNFGELYGSTGQWLNVYGGYLFWINQNAEGQFVLNRCDQNGGGLHSVVFTEFDATYLTRMTVAADGVYFLAGIHGDFNHRQSGTLYRTDTDFNVQKRLAGVADYALGGDTLYYLFGNGNVGSPYAADRATFDGGTLAIEPSAVLPFGSIYVLGDYLVVDGYNPYVHSESAHCGDLEVIEIATGRVVRRLCTEAGDGYDIHSVSSDNGGTLLMTFTTGNGHQAYRYCVQTGESQSVDSADGTVFAGKRYTLKQDGLYISKIDGSSPQKII